MSDKMASIRIIGGPLKCEIQFMEPAKVQVGQTIELDKGGESRFRYRFEEVNLINRGGLQIVLVPAEWNQEQTKAKIDDLNEFPPPAQSGVS